MERLAESINDTARRAGGSELKLQGEVDGCLRVVLAQFGIDYDPIVNQSLHRSYAASGRPDSLFGHVVLDYKAPGKLRIPGALAEAKRQIIEGYLNPICTREGVLDPQEGPKWVGVLLDGYDVLFAIFDGVSNWIWTPVNTVNRYTVLTLIQYYRALYRKPLDPYLLSKDFGRDADVAVGCIRALATYATHPTARTTMLFREWRRMFEQVSTYELDQLPALAAWAQRLHLPGHDDPSLMLYCLHTYYALIVKLLTAELVTVSQQFTTESFFERLAHAGNGGEFRQVLARLESGEIYEDLRIKNFLEGDFFAWYLQHFNADLEAALRQVIEVFRGYEPATPRLNPGRCQDLLKVFYSGVIDEQIRHDLGEYYTPDWLAELVLNRVGYSGQLDAIVLDPACGSGTFLVLAIQRFIAAAQAAGLSIVDTVQRVLNQIQGFDLNPLAVISARANYLLALAEYLPQYGADIEIPVYLSDCINIPTRVERDAVPCLAYTLDTELGERQVVLPVSLVQAHLMGPLLHLAEREVQERRPVDTFLATVRADARMASYLGAAEERILRQFYQAIDEFKERDWDEIWCRIIKNHFAPQGLTAAQFIVGNPPWVRWSRLPRRYRRRCQQFCYHYGLVSGRGYAGGIESDISTVVTFSVIDNWLAPGGILGFLITATVFKSDSARGFRRFELPPPSHVPLYPIHIDDLVSLLPFPDATNETSLVVLRKGVAGEDPGAVYPGDGVPYLLWERVDRRGRIDPRLTLPDVEAITRRVPLRATPIADRGSPLFTGTDEDLRAIQSFRGASPYEHQAHKGTTTDLARVYWVKVLAYDSVHRRVKIRTLTEEEFGGARSEGLRPTAGLWIESELVYPLMRGRDLGRFCFETDDWYIIVPNQHYDEMEEEDTFRRHYPLAYRYFSRNRRLLEERSTYRRYLQHRPFYAIYDVGDYTFSRYKVVWMEQQNPRGFRACVISDLASAQCRHRRLIPDHKLYMLSLDDATEAHYVCGALNSRHLRRILGGFLVGKQIGTTIFRYVGVPIFNVTDRRHREVANISLRAHRNRAHQRITDDLPEEDQARLDALIYDVFLGARHQ